MAYGSKSWRFSQLKLKSTAEALSVGHDNPPSSGSDGIDLAGEDAAETHLKHRAATGVRPDQKIKEPQRGSRYTSRRPSTSGETDHHDAVRCMFVLKSKEAAKLNREMWWADLLSRRTASIG